MDATSSSGNILNVNLCLYRLQPQEMPPLSKSDLEVIKICYREKGWKGKRLVTEFPGKNWTVSTINRAIKRLETRGSIERVPGSGRKRSVRTDDVENQVEQLLLAQRQEPDARMSQRKIARQLGISRRSVQRIIQSKGIKSYLRVVKGKKEFTLQLPANSQTISANTQSKKSVAKPARLCNKRQMATGKVTVFHGSFVHSTYEYPAVYLTNHTLAIQDGKIIYFGDKQLFDKQHMQFDQTPEVYTMRDREFLIPGLIDAHLHAPQFVNMGCALDKPLMEWLTAYTFPTEAKFSDLQYAKHIYETVVKGVLRNGTTTASYFATIHTDATLVLCDVIEKLGQRSFVGKVNMDSHSPNYYVEDTDKSIEETERFVQEVMARNNKLLTPVISPRFALSCSAKLMMALGNIAKKYDLPIQSHICENKCEIQTVLEAFSVCSCYSEIYEKLGLLTNRSYLAHGVYLSDKELGILKETGTGIVHCPNSNISLCSGLCDVQRLLNAGIKVGLGTDISGGFSPSMLDAIRCAVQTSKIISFDQVNYDILSHEVAFSLATLGNSHVLGLQNQIGNFEVGKEFDAILVDATFPNIPSEIDAKEELKDLFQRFIYAGDDRNLEKIYVAGKVVAGASVKPNAI